MKENYKVCPQNNIQNLLPDSKYICFVVESLLSKEECEVLLNHTIRNSFQKANTDYPNYYRNNDRLVLDDQELSERLFHKIKPYLPKLIEIQSTIQIENGTWVLSELNKRLRFCKYSINQYFHKHLDGVYYKSEMEQSKLTFMIYLNSATDFKGGRTLFYKTKESTDIWASYTPKQGDIIVFDHHIWHEGEELEYGEKFVLRSDILYTKQTKNSIKKAYHGHLGYIWKLLKFDDSILLSGGRDKTIKSWNTSGKIVQSLEGHRNSIICIEKINANTFISGSRDKKIVVWEKKENQKIKQGKVIEIHSALILSLCRLTDTSFISSSGDNSIKICDLEGNILQVFTEHKNWVWQVIKLSQNTFATSSEDNTIKIWNTNLENSIETFETVSPTFSLAYNETSKQLVSGDLNGMITIRTLSANFSVINTKTIKAHKGIIRTIKIISDDIFASGGEDNQVKIWDMKNGICLSVHKHQNFVQSLELLNENILLSASYDGTIKKINISRPCWSS